MMARLFFATLMVLGVAFTAGWLVPRVKMVEKKGVRSPELYSAPREGRLESALSGALSASWFLFFIFSEECRVVLLNLSFGGLTGGADAPTWGYVIAGGTLVLLTAVLYAVSGKFFSLGQERKIRRLEEVHDESSKMESRLVRRGLNIR